jgi:hypothetical protein
MSLRKVTCLRNCPGIPRGTQAFQWRYDWGPEHLKKLRNLDESHLEVRAQIQINLQQVEAPRFSFCQLHRRQPELAG